MSNSPKKLTTYEIKLQTSYLSSNTILCVPTYNIYTRNNSTLNLNYHIKILVFED